ncbi:MAG TPA: hypothetical protein VIW25_00645 [Nitrososphaeraceae archaeon]
MVNNDQIGPKAGCNKQFFRIHLNWHSIFHSDDTLGHNHTGRDEEEDYMSTHQL